MIGLSTYRNLPTLLTTTTVISTALRSKQLLRFTTTTSTKSRSSTSTAATTVGNSNPKSPIDEDNLEKPEQSLPSINHLISKQKYTIKLVLKLMMMTNS